MKDYKTIAEPIKTEFTEKKSRFITYLAPVKSEAEATAFISKIAAEHREARHVVYAYSLLDGQIKRFSDAGEPSGTAGMPTLEVLLHKELFNVAVATVRYFGGILLGTGGLTRAYSKGASDAVTAANVITRTWGDTVEIVISYNLYGKVSPYISSKGFPIISSDFSDNVSILIFTPKKDTDALIAEITDMTNGSAQISKKDELFFDI